MKLAVIQQKILDNFDENLSSLSEKIKEAVSYGAEVICLSECFAGEDISPERGAKVLDFLSKVASKNKVSIITGNVIFSNPEGETKEFSAVINRTGKIIGLQEKISSPFCSNKVTEDGKLNLIDTDLGKIIILSQLDCIDGSIEEEIISLEPDLIVMQFSSVSLLESEAVKELALSRSLGEANVVITASLVGKIGDRVCLGNSFIAFQGEIITEAAGNESVMVVELDSSRFFKYKGLRETVVMPDLLKQKFERERYLAGGI